VNYLLVALICAVFAASPEPKLKKSAKAAKAAAADGEQKKDPVEEEYEKLLERDEAALKEIERLNAEFEKFDAKGVAGSKAVLAGKIEQTLDPVRKAYEDFLLRHSEHVDARIAYGSFLNELGEEEEAIVQWEKARSLDPKNPSPWNNLANVFGHIGPVKKAFQYYEKAIELDPTEPVYLQNLATTTYLFRKDAAETYRIDEEGVFAKALELYQRAMKLDPTNILLATDYAQSFYGIKPLRTDDAVAAWKHALTLAKSEAEKEGIYIHLARVELNSGRFADADQHLSMVKDPEMIELRERLKRNLEKKKAEAETGNKPDRPVAASDKAEAGSK
jgi:tetratricopeptide (TPR) repeat protein